MAFEVNPTTGKLDLVLSQDEIDHTNLLNIGVNSHVQIDSHIADGTLHFLEGSIDHGSILGLSDDDHTQYALLAGRSGGQTLIGGLASGEDLILNPTTHTTKGNVAIVGTSPLEFRPGSDIDMVVLKVADQTETAQISLGTNPINTLNRWEFTGLGGLFAGATIESDFTAPNNDSTSIGMRGTTKVTYKSSGTYNIYGKLTSIEPNFGSSSVVNSGTARGHRIELLDVVGASFIEGTQDKVILADLYLSISDLPSSAGTINTSIGVNLDINKNWSSVEPTLTNGYGFKIVNLQATNAWGLYLEPTNLNNWIAGTLGIGVANSTPTSTFSVEGSVEFTALSVSTNTTLTSNHCIVFVDASGGAVTITLPTPVVFAPSRFYYIYKVDASANVISVIASGTDTLVGTTNTGTQYNMLKLVGLTATSWISSEI